MTNSNVVYFFASNEQFFNNFSAPDETSNTVNLQGDPGARVVLNLGDMGDTLITRGELNLVVDGGNGDDVIQGSAGDDIFFHSASIGRDELTGSAGFDTFIFDNDFGGGRTLIRDYDVAEDRLSFTDDFDIADIHFGGVDNTFINDLRSGEVIGVIEGISPDVMRAAYPNSSMDHFNSEDV